MTTPNATKKSQIRIDVMLDEKNLPISIEWDADDSGNEKPLPAKAMMLSLFDAEKMEALRIDLWNHEMRVDEMNVFLYQTLVTMADTVERSTGNEDAANLFRETAHQFGHIADIFGPEHHH